MTMKEFSFYDTVAVIAPGTILVIGMAIICFPNQGDMIKMICDVSMGGLGIGLILAYVAGQLLQAVGNAIENGYWKFWGGMPTDWVRTGRHDLLEPSQRTTIESRLQIMLKAPDQSSAGMTAEDWYSITRQVYAAVAQAKHNGRIDTFNGIYGLCRGVAAGLLVLLVTQLISNWKAWKIEVLLLILLSLAIYRMHRFGVRYARELFVQFLELPNNQSKGDGK